MKNLVIYSLLILTIAILFLFLRAQGKKSDYLEKKIENLDKHLRSLEANFEVPFKDFQHILSNELMNPPSTSIEAYEELIKLYKNTYWAHEAKKRIQNIKNRSIYWSKEKGWDLPKIDSVTKKNPEPHIISCPGC